MPEDAPERSQGQIIVCDRTLQRILPFIDHKSVEGELELRHIGGQLQLATLAEWFGQ